MNNLKLLRTQKGLSQQKLADMLNVSQQSIYKYENDLSEPDIQTLKEISHIFNTSIDYIVGNTDFPLRIETYKETELSQRELNIIRTYRNLSANRREIIDRILEDYEHT